MSYQLVPSQQPSPFSGTDRWTDATGPHTSPPDREGVPLDLARLWSTLRRRWWLLALFTSAAGTTAVYMVRSRPRIYSATAVVQLADTRNTIAEGLVGDNADYSQAYTMLSQIEIIGSRAVANAVVDSEPTALRIFPVGFSKTILSDAALDSGVPGLRIPLTFTPEGVRVGGVSADPIPYGMPVSVAGARFIVTRRPTDVLRGSITVLSRDRAVDAFLMGLDVKPRKGTNIIDITYSANDRLSAKLVANRVAHVYQVVNTQMAQQQLHRRRAFIEDQLARTDAQLAEADRALSTFRNNQQAYSSQDKFKAQQAAIVALDVRREELDGNRKMVRALVRKYEMGDEEARKAALSMLASAPEISGDRSPVPDLYRTLIEYQKSRAELISGPAGKATTHPDVERIDTLIASTEGELVAAARAYVALLDARIDALDDARTKDAGALQQIPFAEAAETRLQQNSDALRTQGATLRSEYQQARIAEAAEVGGVEIVDLATRSSAQRSNGVRIVAFSVFLGLLAGVAVALLLEGADRTIKRRDDIESSLRVPVLGTIPRIDGNELRRGRFPVLTAVVRNRNTTDTTRRRGVAMTAAAERRSPGAEAFRHLATNILYSRAGDSARRILVTSPTEGDGKTSVAANLAITLANQRYRVLLVDCDRFGRLHTIFQVPSSPGLSDVVLDQVIPAEVIRTTDVAGLCLMTSGRQLDNAKDVIGSDRMRAMLSDLAQDFDLVILDCSPILALADSTILSVNSDAVLLVVRLGHTAATAALEAMRNLSTVGARVGGVVLNDPDERARHYGDYQYGYSYAGR